jgi:hypothetical protein
VFSGLVRASKQQQHVDGTPSTGNKSDSGCGSLLQQAVRENQAGLFNAASETARLAESSAQSVACTRNASIVLAMSLKAAGRLDEALHQFAVADAGPYGRLAMAEIEMERGNVTGVLVHRLEGMRGDAAHDRYWKLLAEVLGAFGLWHDALSVVERCAVEACSFAGLATLFLC